MARTRRSIWKEYIKIDPRELTWRGLGDTEPSIQDNPRHAHVHGYDGGGGTGAHKHSRKAQKRNIKKKIRAVNKEIPND